MTMMGNSNGPIAFRYSAEGRFDSIVLPSVLVDLDWRVPVLGTCWDRGGTRFFLLTMARKSNGPFEFQYSAETRSESIIEFRVTVGLDWWVPVLGTCWDRRGTRFFLSTMTRNRMGRSSLNTLSGNPFRIDNRAPRHRS